MFDRKFIQEKIDIIFNVEENNILQNRAFHYIEKAEIDTSDPSKPLRKGYSIEPLMDLQLRKTDQFYLQWPTYDTLKQLYNKIEVYPQTREIFIDILKEKLLNGKSTFLSNGQLHDDASLAFYFLMKIGKNDLNLEILMFRDKKKRKYPQSRIGLFEEIYTFMHLEPEYFDDTTLSILKEINSQQSYFAGRQISNYVFNQKINELRYNKLQNELTGINEELNIDKEKMIVIMKKYGFPQQMEVFLLELDKLNNLSDSKILTSGMISNLRSFFEALIKNIAKQIKSRTGEDYPKESKGQMGNFRIYIKKHLELSDVDNKFISSFIDILHKEGGHAFSSEKKYLVLTKNIGIEIAYFLLSKLEDFLESPDN